MAAKIIFQTILSQLKFDLIGKDSQRGITLTYGWLANQFGHFSLGFIPTLLFYAAYSKYCNFNITIWAPLSTVILWTTFEIYNFFVPLIKPSKKNAFKPDWLNVGFDTCSDLIFFYTGTSTAMRLHSQAPIFLIFSILLFLITIILFTIWYPIKMYTQYSFFPNQMRLSQWNNTISDKDKETILSILSTKENTHILIFGSENSGKTSLAVAIATEFSIKRNACFYSTGIKFLQLLHTSNSNFIKNISIPWSWRDTKCIIIDDINAATIQQEILSPTTFKINIENSAYKNQNIETLHNSIMIWIIGKTEAKQDWLSLLHSYNIQNLVCIEL